ncbi:hypothetical protein FOA52_003345 [Chlamydomonas sp. UWO 241]|nr:hypothetical protein FOA52_003345 [Chlamydomonas sp. UWO 241]
MQTARVSSSEGRSAMRRHAAPALSSQRLPSLRSMPPRTSDSQGDVAVAVEALDYRGLALGTTIISMCAIISAGVARPAAAEERAWKPRRHFRRMGERIGDDWAEQAVELEETAKEQTSAHSRYIQDFRRTQQEEEFRRMKSEQDARVKRANQLMSQPDAARNLPFSVKVGNTELVPYMFWLAVFGVVAYTTRNMWGAMRKGSRGGRWVYDRSMGGKKVWVSDSPSDLDTLSGRVAVRSAEFDRLVTVAAVGNSTVATAAPFQLPAWWNPPPTSFAGKDVREARQAEADKQLTRIEQSKNRGEDYALADILRLRVLCQEGGVTVETRTKGGRDAIYKAAVEAAVMYAQDRTNSDVNLGDQNSEFPETRFVTALAGDLKVADERAASSVRAAAAAACRSRLLDALKLLKEDNEMDALVSLLYLSSLTQNLPALTPGSAEPELIASSLQSVSTVDERKKIFYILGQLHADGAALYAEMLGFEAAAVVPKLFADVEALKNQVQTREGGATPPAAAA